MKSVIVTLGILAASSMSFAADQSMCKEDIFTMVGADASKANVSVVKTLTGTVDKANVSRGEVESGTPCKLELTVYQAGSSQASVSVTVSNFTFNPFNHFVKADSSSCANSRSSQVYGSYSFRQDSGWHHHFGTEISLKQNTNGTYTLSYKETEGAFFGQSLTCTGTLN